MGRQRSVMNNVDMIMSEHDGFRQVWFKRHSDWLVKPPYWLLSQPQFV